MDAADATSLYASLVSAGVRTWVIGGWGVDALLGEVTRKHKDLDVLVHVDDLPLLAKTLAQLGFSRDYEWGENRPVTLPEGVFDTAFVASDDEGRMLDVHAVEVDADGVPRWAYEGHLALPLGALHVTGTIAAQQISCASAAAQVAMHMGYDAPPAQVKDRSALLRLLDEGVAEEFADPTLAGIYDPLDPDRSDLDAYVGFLREVGAHDVLDMGCGTGELANLLAGQAFSVTALDPAAASLGIAGRKAGAQQVRWIHGTSAALGEWVGDASMDAAVMTGNVQQVFTTDQMWAATLADIARVIRPGGRLIFETRIPARQGWLEWTRDQTEATVDIPGHGPVHSWCEVTDIALPLVTFRWTIEVGEQVHTSTSTLRFWERDELVQSLDMAGFDVVEVREAPDRPGREWVFVTMRR